MAESMPLRHRMAGFDVDLVRSCAPWCRFRADSFLTTVCGEVANVVTLAGKWQARGIKAGVAEKSVGSRRRMKKATL
jgi:hypothetical protein